MADLEFRPLQRDELPLLHEWLRRPHVARWWNDGEQTLDEVVAHYLPALERADPTDHFMALLDGRPVGFLETYLIADHPEWDALVKAGPGVAGVDLFVAEPELTGRGLGTEMLKRFVDEIVFAPETTTACLSDVDVDNAASLGAFEKAGFRRVGEIVDTDTGRPHVLLRRDRYAS